MASFMRTIISGTRGALTMAEPMDDDIWNNALEWHSAQQQDDCDWDGFTAWLEADARHRAAFDEVALLEDSLARACPALQSILPSDSDEATAKKSVWRNPWAGLGAGAAAAAIALLAVPMLATGGGQIAYQTGPSQTRSIDLADGSHVQLAAASSLVMGKGGVREMTLKGTAWFDIPHNPSRTLVIHAGDFRVTDIGTKFEMDSTDHNLRVAIAEGAVSIASDSLPQPVRLKAGQRFMTVADLDIAEIGPVDPRDVGSWRQGRLVYQNAPLSLVAADINRYAPTKVSVDPAIAGRRFSGVLSIGDGSALVGNLQQFMGLSARKQGDGVRLAARDGR